MTRLIPLLFALGVAASGADSARIIYTKSFPGSTPAYVSITVDRSGSVACCKDRRMTIRSNSN